jgi:hypothetical protein
MVAARQLIMNPENTARFILIQPANGETVSVQPQRTLNWKYKNQHKKLIRLKLLKEQVKNDNNSAQLCSGEDIKFLYQVAFKNKNINF